MDPLTRGETQHVSTSVSTSTNDLPHTHTWPLLGEATDPKRTQAEVRFQHVHEGAEYHDHAASLAYDDAPTGEDDIAVQRLIWVPHRHLVDVPAFDDD
jgi:hypothetical protein